MSVPMGTSVPKLPGTVTTIPLCGWRNCRWLPLVVMIAPDVAGGEPCAQVLLLECAWNDRYGVSGQFGLSTIDFVGLVDELAHLWPADEGVEDIHQGYQTFVACPEH